ncbi:alpha/beta hydrolase fold-domain-containing protein [Xylariaceae sp. FL0016]|nr:alpha/beta hydrolase fold-domain-containing protein [Xylariaceae sp. FL0016]
MRDAANRGAEIKAAAQLAAKGLPEQVAVGTVYVPSCHGSHQIPIRRFVPRDVESEEAEGMPPPPTVIQFHGGGYLVGSEKSGDCTGARMAADARVTLLSVIYRHTPEHAHPAQHDDAWDAFEYFCAYPEKLGVSLERGLSVFRTSAGGGLAAGLVYRELQRARAEPERRRVIRGAVLFAPWLLHIDAYPFERFKSREVTSKEQCRDAPVLPWKTLKMLSDLVAAPVDDVLFNIPSQPADQLRGWPRTAFLVCGLDPLREDSLLFASNLEELQTPTSVDIFTGLPHGFQNWDDLTATAESERVLKDAVRWSLEMNAWEKKDPKGWREH